VNAPAKINVPFGTSLTDIAKLPPGAQRDLTDRFAEKKSPWPKLIALFLVLYVAYLFCDRGGFINQWTGGRFGTKKVEATAPAKGTPGEKPGTEAPKPAEAPTPAK
jgi:hypothetical protein